jgi:hypothetical protein
MGLLAEIICESKRGLLANRRRALIIEMDVCRRLGIHQDNERLERLSVAVSTIEGGRRWVEVVEVYEAGGKDPLLAYGIKPSHGSEPWSAEKASVLGLGPQVLDVTEDGVVLEEYYPHDANIRHRKPSPNECGYYAESLSSFFCTFIHSGEDELICHKDQRPEHIFILGHGKNIRVKLIDWGRASVCPLDEFREWSKQQFSWFYEYLSFHQPRIWTTFMSFLVSDFPRKLGLPALAEGYREFVRDQTRCLSDNLRRIFGVKFLEFIVQCGRLDLEVGWLNDCVEKHKCFRGEDLVRAYREAEARHEDRLPGTC